MKSRPVRIFLAFVAAAFFANNLAHAARVCIAEWADELHTAAGATSVTEAEHQCPSADDAGLCLTHCTQGFKNSDQRVPPEVPGAVLAPILFTPYASTEAWQAASFVAGAPRFVGPPLTILFRNFRN